MENISGESFIGITRFHFPQWLSKEEVMQKLQSPLQKSKIRFESRRLRDELKFPTRQQKSLEQLGRHLYGRNFNLNHWEPYNIHDVISYHAQLYTESNLILGNNEKTPLQASNFSLLTVFHNTFKTYSSHCIGIYTEQDISYQWLFICIGQCLSRFSSLFQYIHKANYWTQELSIPCWLPKHCGWIVGVDDFKLMSHPNFHTFLTSWIKDAKNDIKQSTYHAGGKYWFQQDDRFEAQYNCCLSMQEKIALLDTLPLFIEKTLKEVQEK